MRFGPRLARAREARKKFERAAACGLAHSTSGGASTTRVAPHPPDEGAASPKSTTSARARQGAPHFRAPHAPAAAVHEAHLEDAAAPALVEVVLDHGHRVPRRERVQVELARDGKRRTRPRPRRPLTARPPAAAARSRRGCTRSRRARGACSLADGVPGRAVAQDHHHGPGRDVGQRRARGRHPAAAQRPHHHLAHVAPEHEEGLGRVFAGEALLAQALDLRVHLLQAARRVVEVDAELLDGHLEQRRGRGRSRGAG